MADPILEALAQAQNQALASNPYAQFGSVMGQAKNPYARTDDPWGALAANAAQSLFAGMATGYGQNQVRQELNQIAPQIPALYADPMSVNVAGNDILAELQRVAEAKKQGEMQQLNFIEEEEKRKLGVNPKTISDTIQAERDKRNYIRELSATLGVKAPAASGNQELPAFNEAFKGPAATPTVPTQQPQSQVESPIQGEVPVPDVGVRINELLSQQLSVEDATAQAMSERKQALDLNRELKLKAFDAEARAKQSKADAEQSQNAELSKSFMEKASAIDDAEQQLSKYKEIVKTLPDYFLPGSQLLDEGLARAPIFGKYSENANVALDSAASLKDISPKTIGEKIQAAKLAPVTDIDLGEIKLGNISEYKTKSQNEALVQNMQNRLDFIKFQNAFWQAHMQKNIPQKEINKLWEQRRAKLGGSFVANGALKPELAKDMERLNSLLGGGL